VNEKKPVGEPDPKGSLGRIDRIGAIFWGIHNVEEIVERVLADYAVAGGKVPIDVLKQRAKERVERARDAAKS
jgi:F0F1-type ATP synthase epsilon subunit